MALRFAGLPISFDSSLGTKEIRVEGPGYRPEVIRLGVGVVIDRHTDEIYGAIQAHKRKRLPGCSVAANWHTPPPLPQALLDQFYNTEENTMNTQQACAQTAAFDPNSYGKALAQAKDARTLADTLKAQVKAQKKAAKKAKRAERQRQDDINLAVDVMADIAGDIDARDEDRLAAAGGLLSHYTDY